MITDCTAPVTQPVQPWREVPAPGPDGRAPAAWRGSAWRPIPLYPSTGDAHQAELVAPTGSGERLLPVDGLVVDGDRVLVPTRAGGRPGLFVLD